MRGSLAIWLGLTFAGVATASPSLEGRWRGECKPGFPDGTSFLPSLTVRGERLRFTLSFHGDAKCGLPSHEYRWSSSVTEGTGDPTPVDFVLKAIWVIPRSEAAAKKFSEEKYCGLESWRVNGPRLVTGKKCGDNQLGARGYRAYSVFRRRGDRLEINPEAAVGDETKRPAEPGDGVYLKQ